MKQIRTVLLLSIFTLLVSCQSKSTNKKQKKFQNNNVVRVVGAMRNVLHKGELSGTISLDTLSNKEHLYGIGPIEYLTGEILIEDGKCFVSKVAPDGTILVEEIFNVSAPFFVYGNVESWEELSLPDSVQTIPQLELFLNQTTKNRSRPFAFRLAASVDQSNIHIMNLPSETEVHSPEEAHQHQKKYSLENENVQMVGFFSTKHKGVFTHHDTYVHIHLITDDKKKMGHLEGMMIKKGTARLYLPAQ